MATVRKFGLGRRPLPEAIRNQIPYDLRQRALPKRLTPRTSRYWYDAKWWLNQGDTPRCVGFAWTHVITDGPIYQAANFGLKPVPGSADLKKGEDAADRLYHSAQLVDEWPGENYEGTSVRAGATVLKNTDFFVDAVWAAGLADVIDCVLERGPVTMGTNWYESMFTPNAAGVISISGAIAGGHAYVVNGINTKTRMFRIKNSWGKSWGKGGHAFIAFHDLERLLKEDGEAVCILETQGMDGIH